jgi:hypothetical protein
MTVTFRAASLMAICLAVFVAGCGSDEGSSEPSPAAEASSPASPSPTLEQASPLEGTWSAGPISQKETEETLRKYGLAKWIEDFNAVGLFKSPLTLSLTIEEGEWDLFGKAKGGQPEGIDYDAEYVLQGDRVGKIHATGATTLKWSVSDDVLTLEWMKTTEPASDGIPDKVFQHALYMTENFKRQS